MIVATCFLETAAVAHATAQFGCAWMDRWYGTRQPDIWEIFGGHTEVSLQAWRQGWFALQPIDIKYGTDLSDPAERQQILDTLDVAKPQLVLVEFPCTYWSSLTNINYRTPEQQRKLKKLREEHRPFVQLAVDIAERQMAGGRDFLLENPLASEARNLPEIQQLERDSRTHTAISHLCQFGLKHPSSGHFMRKPTWWLTSSPEIAYQLDRKCLEDHQHVPTLGGSACKAAAKYPPALAKAILLGYRRLMLRKSPNRLERLQRALHYRRRADRIQAPPDADEIEDWLLKNLREHSTQVIVNEGESIPRDGIEFDLPPEHIGQTPKAMLNALRRLHVNCGHPSNQDLERVVRLAGGSPQACAAAKGLRCTICQKSQDAKLPRPGRIKERLGQFNEVVYADVCTLKDRSGLNHDYIVIIDDGTGYCVITRIPDHTQETFVEAVTQNWIQWAGPPDLLVADGERGIASDAFSLAMGRAGTTYVPAAAYAPWQKGKVERLNRTFKTMGRKRSSMWELSGPQT